MLGTVKKALCCALLWPGLGVSQRPVMPGKLIVTSTPTGLQITVDKVAMRRATPSTFVVSAGEHTVSVQGDAGKKCGAGTPAKVYVDPGSTWNVVCDQTGWKWARAVK